MSLRLVPDAGAFVASVLAAGAAQDRRIERDGYVIASQRIPPPNAHLRAFQTDRLLAAEAGRKGGQVRKIDAVEIARREARKAEHKARLHRALARRAQILRLRDQGLSVTAIARRMGLGSGSVANVIRAHGRKGERGSSVAGPMRAASARDRYGLTLEEFQAYGVIRAKGFSMAEAAEIVIRSRRSQSLTSGGR